MSEPLHSEPSRKESKPLFNRSYLKYLAFIVAIAIIILSEKPATPLSQPKSFENALSALQVLQSEDLAQQRLLLSFLSSPTFTKASRIQRAISYEALRNSAANIPEVKQVLWTQDRLEIELRWPQQQKIALNTLLSHLFTDAKQPISAKQISLIKAQDYLQSKSPDEQLINAFKAAVSSNYLLKSDIPSLKSTPLTALLITASSEQDSLVIDLDKQLANYNSLAKMNFPDTLVWRSKTQTLQLLSDNNKLLIGTQLQSASNQQNRVELLATFVLRELLKQHFSTDKTMNFRLIRQPVYLQGFQLVLLSSDNNIDNYTLDKITQKLERTNIDNLLEDIKNKLSDQYQALTENEDRLFKLYSKKLFYGFKTESSSEYNAQLKNITPEQISAQINKLFKELTFTIRLKSS
jgi:hypothetical protein